MSGGAEYPAPTGRRLDQWLWFARFLKSRSMAARLCASGAVSVNGGVVRKPGHPVRIGDTVTLPLGSFHHSVRVLALGARRGPAAEARQLYRETDAPVRLSDLTPTWTPLLADEELLNG